MGLISRVSSRTYRKSLKLKKLPTNNMGRVRTKTVKKASRRIIEKYYTKLGLDFYTNARIVDEVAIVPTKHLKNQIAGFITHTMKRIQKGPVRGISIKLQEEERERRDIYVPDQSALCEPLELDDTTTEMLKAIDLKIDEAQN